MDLSLSNWIVFGVKLFWGFIAGVAGIALWAHTRQPAWVFVILATLATYIEALLQFLDALGVVSLDVWIFGGVSILRIVLAGVGPILYAAGLILALRSFLKP